uniref:VWFC domain-containing protein n=1 Tax=Sinocyclocheilus anshuiensis TaxID=1608454 RepID=A0A671T645_9TELE
MKHISCQIPKNRKYSIITMRHTSTHHPTYLKGGVWANHCVDGYDNSKHPMGSTWTNGRCNRCICSLGEMECCDTSGRPAIGRRGCFVSSR